MNETSRRRFPPLLLLLAVMILGPISTLIPCPAAASDPDPSGELETLALEFVRQMADEDWNAAVARFDATMKVVAPPEKVREAWQVTLAAAGNFERALSTRMEIFDRYHVVFVTCDFAHASLDVKVVFDPQQRIAGFFFVPVAGAADYVPPSYADPQRYREEDVTVGAEGWPLPGTLTLPRGEGPFPAVVLVHGSGPQDRDETIGPNRPFRDLAWGLASRGIAVLRYEKRTRHYPERLREPGTSITVEEETVADAVAAARTLAANPRIYAGRVFVLGHSLGGMLIPRIAARDERLAGGIILAGSTRPLEDVVVEQYEYLAAADGQVTEGEQRQIDEVRRRAAVIKREDLAPDADPATLPLGVPASYWLDLRGYDPAAAVAALATPLLILQGGRDYQVTQADYQRWVDALAGRAQVEFKLYPALNHLFMTGSGPSTPAEYGQPGHVDAAVIDDIARWVKAER